MTRIRMRRSLYAALIALLLNQAVTLGQVSGARRGQHAGAGTDLIESAKLGDLARARELLSKGAGVDTSDRRGFTPLMWASASGTLPLVRQFLESGADVNRRAHDGSNALMLASAGGFTEVVRALILRGADVTAGAGGVTPRQRAVDRGQAEVAGLLEQAEALGARLLQAASEGHDMAVRQLLSSGAPVNVTNAQGVTALMIAARNGDLGVLQALLSRGADPSAVDVQGKTVFDWADPSPATAKYVVAFLADKGISRNVRRPIATPSSPQVKASLGTIAAILARVPPASDAVRTAARRANTVLSQLQALSAQWPAESPEDYRDNLAGYVAALEAALKAGDALRLAEAIGAVAEDLEVKLDHCTKSGGKLGGSVVVRVRTVQGGEERKSWQVFYMPRVFEVATSASPDLFPQLSSPTEDKLVPGRYVMWVRDPATARLGERTVVKIGEGKKELLLDLPVPATSPQ